jgi:hypothetical protein
MQGIDRGWIATALVLLALIATPARAVEPASPGVARDDATGLDPTTANRLQALVEQSVKFAKEGNLPGVAEAYDALIADPAFPGIPLEVRRMIYSSAADVALERSDNVRSRDLYLQAITANSTDKGDWAKLAWVEFFYTMLFTSDQRAKTLTVAIADLAGGRVSDYGLIATAGVLAALPPVLIGLVMQRALISGLTSGGVKG